ncbi:MAG: hypothetical protein ACREFU_20700, partial [Acetobacteraceae bacterium]
ARHHQVIVRAASELRVSRVTIYRMLERHQLARPAVPPAIETPSHGRNTGSPRSRRRNGVANHPGIRAEAGPAEPVV